MKDRFSDVSKKYAKYRPLYPAALYQFLLQHVEKRLAAWDAGTGNGQVAGELSNHFQQVEATDISGMQLQEAVIKTNIQYTDLPSENTNFNDDQFDLVTVAQALHWFNLPEFFAEAKRVLKPGGLLAVWGYGLIETEGILKDVLIDFYKSLDDYWDAERRHIDEAYANISFPFPEIAVPGFSIKVEWNAEELEGYLSTWSAVKNYINKLNTDPVKEVMKQAKENWGNREKRHFHFHIFMKLGRK